MLWFNAEGGAGREDDGAPKTGSWGPIVEKKLDPPPGVLPEEFDQSIINAAWTLAGKYGYTYWLPPVHRPPSKKAPKQSNGTARVPTGDNYGAGRPRVTRPIDPPVVKPGKDTAKWIPLWNDCKDAAEEIIRVGNLFAQQEAEARRKAEAKNRK